MAILNYTTQIGSERTIAEIQQCLVKHGATRIVTDYKEGLPAGLSFCLAINEQAVAFSLPANYQGVLRAMTKDPKVPRRYCSHEQALRVSWRIVKDWVEAQMAIVEANLADVAEVFLPYAITKSGNTLYKEIQGNQLKLLGNG